MFRLRGRRLGRVPRRELLSVPRALEWLAGGVGVALFAVVVYAGLRGEQNFTSNLAPTAVYVIFWVGIPIASAFVGDLWRPFNPWRAVARAGAGALRAAGREPRPLLG
ncbi:MAG TPA: fenitrothion hydrolase, partial [Solirubrobacterales bacterium]|nr:fenitrothion hydrolase [Solirubrobacterales bacterium]